MSEPGQNLDQAAFDLVVLTWYRRLLPRTPSIVAAAVLGGLLGLAVAWITPPFYRATAVLDIGVDYGRTLWLDEDADQMALARVQGLILSDEVLEDVQQRAATDPGGSLAPRFANGELRNAMHLVWVGSRWELSIVARDPQRAASLANLWAQTALDHLEAASGHAWRVAELQSLYFKVFCRPGSEPGESGPALWVCDEGDPGSAPEGQRSALLREIEASHGIIPGLSFGWSSRADAPVDPEIDRRPLLALGGLLVGLLAGIVFGAARAGTLT